MPRKKGTPKQPKHTPEERQRVLNAIDNGENWIAVATANGFSRGAMYRLFTTRRIHDLPRGGLRAKTVKVTPEIMISLEAYLENEPTMPLDKMCAKIWEDHGVDVSTSTVSAHLLGLTYTVKQVRMEKDQMNSVANKADRRDFALKLEAHRGRGDLICYVDETNYNVYISRTQGRAPAGERAISSGPISQGQNLIIQLAVAGPIGVVEVNLDPKKIDMDMNASFLLDVFAAGLRWADNSVDFLGKQIVLVIDNAPAHERSEEIVKDRVLEDHLPLVAARLVILRLAPYSPMCNPIENCFSVFKSYVKSYIAEHRHELRFQPQGQTHEGRKHTMLLAAAEEAIKTITQYLVQRQEIHAAKWWEKAKHLEDMRLGE